MSYPGVDLSDAETTNPVGTQERSESVPQTPATPVAPQSPTPPALLAAADKAHEDALHNPALSTPVEDLNAAVAQAVTDMFKVNESAWRPKILTKFKIDLPSGQSTLVKHLDTLDLVEYDLIEELDFFTRKLFPESIDLSGNPVDVQQSVEDNIWTALREPAKRKRFLDMTGKLVATAALRPKVIHDGVAVVDEVDEDGNKTGKKITKFGYELTFEEQLEHFKAPIPKLGEQQVYSGYIDFADRMVFFQELNKPMELIQPFREEQNAMLQDLARGEGDGGTT